MTAGVTLEIDLDLTGWLQKIGKIGPLVRGINEELLSGAQGRFETETSPTGDPWAKNQRGGKILRDSGVLFGSLRRFEATETEASHGSNLEYAAIHQFGGQAGRNHKTTLPARPYLGVSLEDERAIEGLIDEFFNGIEP